MSPRALEEVIYFASYVVTIQEIHHLKRNNYCLKKNIVHTVKNTVINSKHAMGAEAIKKLLHDIDLNKEAEMLKGRT